MVNKNVPPLTIELKKAMAHAIISKFWSTEEADSAQAKWEALHQKKDYSHAPEVTLPEGTPSTLWIVDFLKAIKSVKTSSEAKRLIEDGAVELDKKKITDFKEHITWTAGMTVRVGKHRIYRIR